ncbi:MAG: sterol desaturase family protein [Bacteroidetes bacterium]|nr:sterol desaturase family protein [Bacteroidota bacterium]
MTLNPVAFIVPAFLLFAGIEYLIAKQIKKQHLFNYEASIANISVGMAERLLNLFITGAFYSLYEWAYQHRMVTNIPDVWWVWGLLLLITDMVWYWYHRLGHEINLFWGAHIVHHQSEEFNYTVSARITTLQAIVRNSFWLIIPWIGFHPHMVVAILVLHGTYSFFTHTQLIDKLGWLEKILITPSHHGVHHASNSKYLDKNYGDIFVFWDKLFGTFQAEDEKPVYGLVHPLHSKSFLWQHFHFYLEMTVACMRSGGFRQSMKIIFGKPDMIDPAIRKYLEYKILQRPASKKTLWFRPYLTVQIGVCLVSTFLYILFYWFFTPSNLFFILLLILITLINCGAIMEQQRWVYQMEWVRGLVAIIYVSIIFNSLFILIAYAAMALYLTNMDSLQQKYFRYVFGSDLTA